MNKRLEQLATRLQGDLFTDKLMRILYSTDASDYKELPLAVARPKTKDDIKKLIQFARKNHTSLIPRTAGTSLAGQVVGNGIVVDVSKYMTRILEINAEQGWVRVEPGVVLDELNQQLEAYGLFFGPETSTSNRCMMGGMVGNNSCGAHAIIYGTTRDHTLSIKTILSDGSEVCFEALSDKEFEQKLQLNTLEGAIYRNVYHTLSNEENQKEIRKEFPDPKIYRRNTGYAIDLLLDTTVFNPDSENTFNLSKLLAGSEGTLAFSTEIKLNLVPLPPKEKAVVAAHFNSLVDALRANIIALKYNPGAVELMDSVIIDCTKESREHRSNRFFLKGAPAAILMIEFARNTRNEIAEVAQQMEDAMREAGYGYHFPVIYAPDTTKVWDLRKAGLGLLANVPGDRKSVTVIEDTAVSVGQLPDYVAEFKQILEYYGLSCVFYAHVGSGELHLRPMLNLKDPNDVELFYSIGREIAGLVKKYNGSLSGEHGDGRLRGEFIPLMVGKKNYELFRHLKAAWDPDNIFNPGKIVDTPSMKTNLKYKQGKTRKIPTVFDFSATQGIVRAAEKCTGSGDCRKSHLIGGTMCPSFMATRDEQHSTRARANILRDILTNSTQHNPFNHNEIYEVMDLCLSCKACKKECPSGVDVAKLKAEFLQHYYDANGVPFRSIVIANIAKINRLAAVVPRLSNFFMRSVPGRKLISRVLSFAPQRQMPALYKTTLQKWYRKNFAASSKHVKGRVYFFNDEMTNYNDTAIGIKTLQLLTRLGYEVVLPEHTVSGRTYLSKGLVRRAKEIANKNVSLLKDLVSAERPLVGVEPSAILSFRDEYPELVDNHLKIAAVSVGASAFTIEEFLWREMEKGHIKKNDFTDAAADVRLHGHCQQKAIASTEATKAVLSFPENYRVDEIPSGCCGMAGAFGYEKEHYETSMKVGELVLFPYIRGTAPDTIIAAPGTSCRHQIADGTGRKAVHPVEVLYHALV